jgi:hypothetical protein
MTISQGPSQSESFDPTEVDCFARFINKNDQEVSDFLTKWRHWNKTTEAEYDQDDTVLLDYDDVADLITIADYLWRTHWMKQVEVDQ